MEVTKVVIQSIKEKPSGVCAEATIYLDDVLCIHKIKVVNGKKGLFVTFPNNGDKTILNGKKRFNDVVHPLNSEIRNHISDKVISEYLAMTT